MSKTITIIGDVMLGRIIGSKYSKRPYQIVSDDIIEKARNSDFVIANLESPVVKNAVTEGDHMQFKGNPDILQQLKWIDAFSLANNHINDCGTLGMDETTSILERHGFKHNGLFKEGYKPLLIDNEENKIAIITITDMLNIPIATDCKWDILRVGEARVLEMLKKLHEENFCVILFAHIGILFSRYPNPITYEYLHQCADNGADIIVTTHSHCLGCMETYKGKPIFHSLGDFVMDGNSFRRRKSGMLKLTIERRNVINWEIIPTEINLNYETISPTKSITQKMLRDFGNVSKQLESHSDNYASFFKWQYKKEMVIHTCSTLSFLTKTRGVAGTLKMIFKRFEEVLRMFKWMTKDRTNDQRDDETVRPGRKKITEEELFNGI